MYSGQYQWYYRTKKGKKTPYVSPIKADQSFNQYYKAWYFKQDNGYPRLCDEIFDSVFDEQIKKQIQIIKKNTEEIHSLIAFTGQYQDLRWLQPEWQNIHQFCNTVI